MLIEAMAEMLPMYLVIHLILVLPNSNISVTKWKHVLVFVLSWIAASVIMLFLYDFWEREILKRMFIPLIPALCATLFLIANSRQKRDI